MRAHWSAGAFRYPCEARRQTLLGLVGSSGLSIKLQLLPALFFSFSFSFVSFFFSFLDFCSTMLSPSECSVPVHGSSCEYGEIGGLRRNKSMSRPFFL